MSVFKQMRAMTRLGWVTIVSILLICIWGGYLLLTYPLSIEVYLAFAVLLGCHWLVVYQAKSRWKIDRYLFKFETSHLALILWDASFFIPFTGLMLFFVDQKAQTSWYGISFLVAWFLIALLFRGWVRRSYTQNYQTIVIDGEKIFHFLFKNQFVFDKDQIKMIRFADGNQMEIDYEEDDVLRVHIIVLGRIANINSLKNAVEAWWNPSFLGAKID